MPDVATLSLPILILAAGRSSRMRGTDKLAEVVDGLPLLRRQAVMARAATEGPVIVTLPAPPHARYAQLDGLDVIPLAVPDADDGLSASLRAGLAALPAETPAAMILLADLPELELAELRAVLAAVDTDSATQVWRGATAAGKPGHPLVVAAPLFSQLMAQRGDTGGREVLAAARDRTVLIPLPGHRALRDLDTPEDWASWRAERDG